MNEEMYGRGMTAIPAREEVIGQDLIRQNHQLGRETAFDDGKSNSSLLCVLDPRPVSPRSTQLTFDLKRMNARTWASRFVDRAVTQGHPDIGGLLVQLHYAIWIIRTGDAMCSEFEYMEFEYMECNQQRIYQPLHTIP